MNAVRELPPITISNYDFDRLIAFGLAASHFGDHGADFLLSELRRATLCPARELPEDVVSVNCRVSYRRDDHSTLHAHSLVHPSDLVDPEHEIAATSPLGIALLGLRAGDRMPFCDAATGCEYVVEVVSVDPRGGEEDPHASQVFDRR
ncbi:GreA/GreB family elongation factor [Methylobacterium sp. CM6257]